MATFTASTKLRRRITMRTTLTILGVIALLVAMLIGSFFGGLWGRSAGRQVSDAILTTTPTDIEIENLLMKTANENNSQLPRMIDEYARLERVVAGPGKKYTNHLTHTGYSSTEINHASADAFAAKLKQNACASKGMGGFFKHGISVVYIVSGNDAREIVRVTVTPADCGYR